MADEYFVGLRATGDLATNERPESWRDGILRLFPNGMAPLTAITALMPSEKVTDPHFHWWTKTLTTQRAAVTDIYTDAALGTPYVSGGTAGDVLYVKISYDNSKMFRQGHQVLLRDADDYAVDVVAKVNSVNVLSDSLAYLAVTLLEDDDNSSDNDLSDCDTVLIIGNMNPMGGTRPEAVTQSPTEFDNYTQIWRNSLDLSRTLMETKLRTAQAYTEAKRDALEQHSIEMEKSFLWGIESTGSGANGKPEYTTAGLLSYIKSYGVVEDFTLDTGADYDGTTWSATGVAWINEHLEEIFRYGGTQRLALCGSGAMLGIQNLVLGNSVYNIEAREAAFGIRVVEWTTPFGVITLKTHPLFSYEATNRNSMLLLDPKLIRFKYVTDTTFMPDTSYMKGGNQGVDGKQEEFITEGGLEVHHPETMGYLNGIGLDNPA